MRIATFNIENLDENTTPSLADRIEVLRPQLTRLNADILCLQEVHGQERPNQPRQLLALKALINGTIYDNYEMVHTTTTNGQAYDVRNLVILSKFPITDHDQYNNDLITDLKYKKIMAVPAENTAKTVRWERPILHAKINHPDGTINVINLHLKSRLPSNIPGQAVGYGYKSAAGWAEGYFLSSMKRVGQSLEVCMLVDKIYQNYPQEKVVVCGDFNAEPGNVPVEAIVGSVENTGNKDLVTRQLFACSDSVPENLRFTHIHHGQKNLLDHIIISQNLIPFYQGAEIHNESIHDESVAFAYDTKYPESDHAPFVAKFNL